MKTIKYQDKILDLERRPLKIAKYDDDGEVVWKTAPLGDIPGVPEAIVADTPGLIRNVLRVLANVRLLFKADDPQRTAGIYLALDTAEEEGGDIRLGTKSYDWFHAMLGRQLPLNEEAKKAELVPESFAHTFWGNSCDVVQNQLRDESDKVSFGDES